MLSIGMNRKLKAGKIAVFNLPARKDVCGRECPGCYAKKAQRIYKQVLPSRERNLTASMSATFVAEMVVEIEKAIRKGKVSAVRVHEAGDFYSQAYIDSWHQIAQYVPTITFYAYTKRKNNFDFSALEGLDNFVLIDSTKFGPVNYGDGQFVQSLIAQGAFLCPASETVSCNNGCDICLRKSAQYYGVAFHKH
jgi:hypothetical protein